MKNLSIEDIKSCVRSSIGDDPKYIAHWLDLFSRLDSFSDDEKNNITSLRARVSTSQKDFDGKLISKEEYDIETSKIRQSFLNWVSSLEFKHEDISIFTSKFEFKQLYFRSIDTHRRTDELEAEIDNLVSDVSNFCRGLEAESSQRDWTKSLGEEATRVAEKWRKRTFSVAVLATIKAGKSTLLNAWIGDEYLPSATIAETMQAIRVLHRPDLIQGQLLLDGRLQASGPKEIRDRLRILNAEARAQSAESKIKDATLRVNVAAFQGRDFGKHNFEIIDTAGGNESGVAILRSQTEKIISESDVVVYILDFTKLKTSDEGAMFERIKSLRKDLLSQVGDRLYFVVNKIDNINRHDHEKKIGKREVPAFVAKLLSEALETTVGEEKIVLASAEQGLLARLISSGKATTEQTRDFERIAFGQDYDPDDESPSQERLLEAAKRMLDKSGMSGLESRVFESIYSRRTSILFSSIIKDLQDLILRTENDLSVAKATLDKDKIELESLNSKLVAIQSELQLIDTIAMEFKKKATEIVKVVFNGFQGKVRQAMIDFFVDSGASKNGLSITAIFGKTDYTIEFSTQSELDAYAKRLWSAIINATETWYVSKWQEAIGHLYEKHLDLLKSLESKITPLIRQIERALEETLEIKLYPIMLDVPRISSHGIRNDIWYQIQGSKESVERSNLNWIQKSWNFLFSWLGIGFKEQRFQVFSLNTKKVWEELEAHLRSMGQSAIETAKEYIDESYVKSAKSTQSIVEDYADRYLQIIHSEIAAKSSGEVDINARIQGIETDLEKTRLHHLRIQQVNDLQIIVASQVI